MTLLPISILLSSGRTSSTLSRRTTGWFMRGSRNPCGSLRAAPSRFLRGRLAVERSWMGRRAARGNLRSPVLRLHLVRETDAMTLVGVRMAPKFRLLTVDQDVLRFHPDSRRGRKPWVRQPENPRNSPKNQDLMETLPARDGDDSSSDSPVSRNNPDLRRKAESSLARPPRRQVGVQLSLTRK